MPKPSPCSSEHTASTRCDQLTPTLVLSINSVETCLSRVTHATLTYKACLQATNPLPHTHTPPSNRPHTTLTKGYHAGILIYMWNVLSYASSSVYSAIWLLPCDSESLTLLIEWVLVWNTHTGKHTSIHVHTHWWLCCKWREGEGWVSGLAWWANINHCLSASPFFSTPTPLRLPLLFFCLTDQPLFWVVVVCVCMCVWRMRSDHMDKTRAVRRCYRSQLPIKSCVVYSRTSRSWQTRCILISFTCDRH